MQKVFKYKNINLVKSAMRSLKLTRHFSTSEKPDNSHSISDLFDFTDEQKEFCDNVYFNNNNVL